MSILINKTESSIRFSEVDSIQIVWHGNYVKYLEDGREAFGNEFDFDYHSIAKAGFVAPVVNVNIDYKQVVKYGDKIIIETEFVNVDAAKLIFKYRIFRKSDNKLAATGTTTQVFLNQDGELQLTNPDFYIKWKKKYKLISD